jgi:hypothetical protein
VSFYNAGLVGGRVLKNRQKKVTEVEMKNLSVKRSSSLPDIASQSGQQKGWLPWR